MKLLTVLASLIVGLAVLAVVWLIVRSTLDPTYNYHVCHDIYGLNASCQ
ncbi:MAG: hypothetical protein ACYDBV_08670 [Nitrospiria bacterium]